VLLSFDFPTEVVKEGKVHIVVPKLKAFVKEPWEYAPSKAPVFYNPLMESNRDLAVLALQVYQKMVKREISVCEPLAGCGIRSIRLAREVEGIKKIILNDINPKAAKLAEFNVDRNKLTERALVFNRDANLLLAQHAAPRRRFGFIDIDPFGPPVSYMDSAVRALRNGGLLALTATDLAPLCGVHHKACLRKYGGRPLRTEYCHELAVRLLAGCLVMMAAKHEIGVQIVFSRSTYNYARVYAIARYGAKQADNSVHKMGYILHCFNCFHRETSEGVTPAAKRNCPACGSRVSIAGPLWLGKLWTEDFCTSMRKLAVKRKLKNQKRILKLLSTVEDEINAPITYYVMDKICDKLGLSVPPLAEAIEALEEAGFQATRTHFNSKAFRTDASAEVVRETVMRLSSVHGSNLK
jgi:tRNA (guanine26-N2/guanine27-N2)-dimethyltransferase